MKKIILWRFDDFWARISPFGPKAKLKVLEIIKNAKYTKSKTLMTNPGSYLTKTHGINPRKVPNFYRFYERFVYMQNRWQIRIPRKKLISRDTFIGIFRQVLGFYRFFSEIPGLISSISRIVTFFPFINKLNLESGIKRHVEFENDICFLK